MLNNDAALIFGTDLEAALPTLPPPLQAAVKALPAFEEVKRKPYVSELRAIDPLTGQTRWSVPTQGWQDRSGVLTTAGGLLFQGSIDGTFRVFDKRDGRLLKSIDTGSSILAAPMTYRVNGVQYVAVMAAWGGGGFPYVPRYSAAYKRGNRGRILAFKLGGGAVPIPPELPPLEPAPPPPAQKPGVTADTLERGRALFFGNCVLCHSNQHRSITPDLRRMQPAHTRGVSQHRARGRAAPERHAPLGRPLSAADVDAIHAYLIDLQARTRAEELAKQKAGVPLDAPSLAILSNY